MIITRSPLRITLGGGGTDLPSYYSAHGGFLLAAAIDQYIYMTLHKTFVPELIIKYSKMERVNRVQDIEHPIFREALKCVGIDGGYLELASMADIPAGTGLGSSGSFTTALLKALHAHLKELMSPQELAEEACHIEMDLVKEPVGKQDPYVSAYGGIRCFHFHPDGRVEANPLKLATETLYNLEENLLLFFTGYSRKAAEILRDQDGQTKKGAPDMIQNLHRIKEMARLSQEALVNGELRQFADMMNEHWELKRKRTETMTNPKIDEWMDFAKRNGALGGKLIGAGGGGFLMFYVEDKVRFRHAMARTGLQEVRFRFDFEGATVVSGI